MYYNYDDDDDDDDDDDVKVALYELNRSLRKVNCEWVGRLDKVAFQAILLHEIIQHRKIFFSCVCGHVPLSELNTRMQLIFNYVTEFSKNDTRFGYRFYYEFGYFPCITDVSGDLIFKWALDWHVPYIYDDIFATWNEVNK